MSKRWPLIVNAIAAALLVGNYTGSALACEGCVRLGTAAFHDRSLIGGDDFNDARLPPRTGLALNFVAQGLTFPRDSAGKFTITYSYNNLLDGGLKDSNGVSLPVSLIRGSIEEAFRVWARHAPLHFVEVPDEGGGPFRSEYPDGQFGEIRFSHVYINGPDIPGQPPIAKAQAYFRGGGGKNLSADVFFDNGDPWQEVGTLSQPDILGAAIHEIGHTLGLGHSADSTANMYWIFRRFGGLGTGMLFDDDIAGIQSRYGVGVGSVTPLHAPEPATAAFLFMALACLSVPRRSRRRECARFRR